MCKVSSEIRFCTCEATDPASLKNYWIFYRYVGDTGIRVMGDLVMPYLPDPETEMYNQEVLLKRVNDPTAFDVDLQPKAKDRLLVHFTCGDSYLAYGYEYRSGQWKEVNHDPFKWEERYEEHQFGETTSGLE